MIYFGDAELVEKHLHQDLNRIIKNVKLRQQQHLQLLEYNKSIAHKKRSIESTIFINDQITTHVNFLQKVLEVHRQVNLQQEEILNKYDQATVKFQSVMRLMARVVTRILQTNQIFVEKIKLFDETFAEHFAKMKNTLTKLINNKEQIDLSLSTKTIIEYSKIKATQSIDKLKLLIKTLEEGQIEKVPFIYKGVKPPQTGKTEGSKMDVLKIEKQPDKKTSPPKKQEKHQLVNKFKNQIKIQQNLKKLKKNIAAKLITMYSTLDLSKKDFIEDITNSNPNQYDRIYAEILLRNKFNQDQILEFQGKKQEFQQKVKRFKEAMLEESKKIQQVLMIKKPIKIQKIQKIVETQSQSYTKIQVQGQIEQDKNPQFEESPSPTREFKRTFMMRQRQPSPRFHKQTDFTQLQITQDGFSHIKFDASNQETFLRSNRNRLPSIQNKQTQSIEQQRYMSRSKEDKAQVRKNFMMKNIELGVQNVIKQNQQKNQSQNKSIAEKLKELQPATPSTHNMNLMDFSFYGSKKKPFVMGQNKSNFVF